MMIRTTPTSLATALVVCVAIVLGVETVPATAASAPPTVASPNPASTADPISATEGVRFSAQVSVLQAQCASPRNPQATIAWGDGGATSAAEVTVSGSQLSFSGSHSYPEEGALSGTVAGSYTCPSALALPPINFNAGFAAKVADAPITITQGPALPAGVTAGQGFTAQIARFTDADPAASAGDYTATVSWGDGTTSSAAIAPAGDGFGATATHTYPTAGSYAPVVRINDEGGASLTAQAGVRVAPAPAPPARLDVRVIPHVGNGTAVLSLNPTQPGVLTIFPVRRHHRLLIAGRTIHVGKAGPVVVVLKSTAAARLQPHETALSAKVKIKFNPLMGGPSITQWESILVDDLVYCGTITYYYTGAEQSCIVPKGVYAVKVIAVGGHGGDVSEPCQQGGPLCPFGNFGGWGGRGALVVDPELPVTPGQTLYIEVGGNGGDGVPNSYEGGVDGGYVLPGQAGAGGWNGGGAGQLPASGAGSGGGGGASDVQTVSYQNLGFWAFLALDSRLVVAGGGAGGGSGGGSGADGQFTLGGYGGDAGEVTWGGWGGGPASAPGNEILGFGGQGGDPSGPGAGDQSEGCDDGADGVLGGGGAGGNDTAWEYRNGQFIQGYAGGGGGGGWYGGGGGGGGCLSQDTVGGGGGGGGGSSYGPPGSSVQVNLSGSQPYVQVIPLG